MSEDLALAAKVHYSFLPDDYEDDRVIVAANLRPLYAIGGDYCSILPLDDNRLLVCTCDAVGHGVPAALFAARINTFVLTHARADLPPCQLVAGLNGYLCRRLGGTGMYTSFYALLLDFSTGTMSFTGAAHPPVLQCTPEEQTCRQWPSSVTFLGISDPMPLACSSETVKLCPGSRFLLFSDGLIEVEGADQQFYGLERLSETFMQHRMLIGQDLNGAILRGAEEFASNGFNDDVLLISIAIK